MTSSAGDPLVKETRPGTFKKGYDPRRNLRGTPKDAITARKKIRQIAAELIHIKEKQDNGEVIEYDITRADAMIRLMFSSKAPADKQTLMKALWPGLLKDEVDITSAGEKIQAIGIVPVDYRAGLDSLIPSKEENDRITASDTPGGSISDSKAPGKDQDPGNGA
jgi:hypothetical protein